MSTLVDVSTVVAATAALWALGFGWLTYVMSVRSTNHDEFLALKSIVEGLRVELELMKPWTGAGQPGYSKKLTLKDAPPDWSQPGRLIYKFNFDAIANLSLSPYLYRLREIVGPFARLNLSISKLFQMYDEYRTFVNSDPAQEQAVAGAGASGYYRDKILRFNFSMHRDLIGGADSDDPECLYKAYDAAVSALDTFDANIRPRTLPWWYLIGHMASSAFAVLGAMLLFNLLRS